MTDQVMADPVQIKNFSESTRNLVGKAMSPNQVLSSGVIIRQDFSAAVRAIFFQTDYQEFLYATEGGTCFIINSDGQLYGLTCKHVFGTFRPSQLFITQEKWAIKGSVPAPIKGLCYPSSPTGEAAETDITDLCAIRFDDISPDFFKGSAYIIDRGTVGTSKSGDNLLVCGVLKSKSHIIPPDITMAFSKLEFRDVGASSSDPFIRQGIARFERPEFDTITGISGSPVFNQTQNVLCGMVVRGGMRAADCTIYYIDISDILRFVEGIRAGVSSLHYDKTVERKCSC